MGDKGRSAQRTGEAHYKARDAYGARITRRPLQRWDAKLRAWVREDKPKEPTA